MSFEELVNAEVRRLYVKKPVVKSWHEAYGLLAEELDEFFDEVKKKTGKRDTANGLHELVQIAALCNRVANDLGLVEVPPAGRADQEQVYRWVACAPKE